MGQRASFPAATSGHASTAGLWRVDRETVDLRGERLLKNREKIPAGVGPGADPGRAGMG